MTVCSYLDWAFNEISRRASKNTGPSKRGKIQNTQCNIVILYVAEVSEKLRKILGKYYTPVSSKPTTL